MRALILVLALGLAACEGEKGFIDMEPGNKTVVVNETETNQTNQTNQAAPD